MRFVKPAVFLIAKSVPQPYEIFRWLEHVGCSEEVCAKYSGLSQRKHWEYKVVAFADDGKTNGERLIELAGRRCYLSFEPGLNPNVTKIREDITDYINNIMKAGHGSVLEHVTFTFAIEGVSRVFTGEMNRHRAGVAISEGSMRYIRFDDIPIVDVPSIQQGAPDGIPYADDPERARSRGIIEDVVAHIETAYNELRDTWAAILNGPDFAGKKHVTSMLRRIIPMGVATGGVWTFNVRALRHMLTMRCSEAAEEEIAVVAGMMLEIMMREEPVLFGDFAKNERGYWTPRYQKV